MVSIALAKIMCGVLKKNGFDNVMTVVCGEADIGNALVMDERVPLISFTGSTIGCYC